MFSLGLSLSSDGAIQEVIWGGPAFDAGLTAGSTILAVDDRAFAPDEIKRAITAAADGRDIALVVKSGKRVRPVSIAHQGGLSYPHLERVEGAPRLDAILRPRRAIKA
jgi:predicted metalloprotease with PDZ domain